MLKTDIFNLLNEIDKFIGCELTAYNALLNSTDTARLFEGNQNKNTLIAIAQIYVADRMIGIV